MDLQVLTGGGSYGDERGTASGTCPRWQEAEEERQYRTSSAAGLLPLVRGVRGG